MFNFLLHVAMIYGLVGLSMGFAISEKAETTVLEIKVDDEAFVGGTWVLIALVAIAWPKLVYDRFA